MKNAMVIMKRRREQKLLKRLTSFCYKHRRAEPLISNRSLLYVGASIASSFVDDVANNSSSIHIFATLKVAELTVAACMSARRWCREYDILVFAHSRRAHVVYHDSMAGINLIDKRTHQSIQLACRNPIWLFRHIKESRNIKHVSISAYMSSSRRRRM